MLYILTVYPGTPVLYSTGVYIIIKILFQVFFNIIYIINKNSLQKKKKDTLTLLLCFKWRNKNPTQTMSSLRSSLLAAAALLHTATAADSKILIVGDSMGEFSCGTTDMPGKNFVQEFCGGASIHNAAVSGSTAWQWRSGGTHSAVQAFKDAGAGVTHVWLSVGGNDWMTPGEDADAPGANSGGCGISTADLKSRIQKAVTAVKEAATADGIQDIKIVMTGYCVPTQPECDGKTDASDLITAYQEIAQSDGNVQFVDISEACGGNSGKKGDVQFFTDAIHLNQRGYCAAFSLDGVQSALGCTSQSVTCSDIPKATCSAGASLAPSTQTVLIAAVSAMAATLMLSVL